MSDEHRFHPASTRDWDADSYDRVSAPQLDWAREVIGRLELGGDETLLDAGCGSGRVTELLVEALPGGRVIGIDASPSMIERARERLGERAELRVGNLLELDCHLDGAVDVIFSNAVFHWIGDHDGLFATLARALLPGGRLEAQCGGEGNVEEFTRTAEALIAEPRWRSHFAGWERPWRFAGPVESEERLAKAGFERPRCWLSRRPARPAEPVEFIRTVCAGPYLELIPGDLQGRFVAELAERLGDPLVLDYVRLNISARRA